MLKDNTKALHSGHDVTKTSGCRAVPIYQTSSYVFDSAEHAGNLFALKEEGFIYTRLNNPTNDILEKRLAALDGGIGAAVFATGTSAISSTLLTLLKAGDHIVASSQLYGGTVTLMNVLLPRFGITTTFVDILNTDEVEAAIKENTKAVYLETIGNPGLDVADFDEIVNIAHKNNLPVLVDNTVATPFLFKPIEHGADIVIYSLTKYMGGHGTTLGGAVVDGGKFNWANGKFPEFSEPSPGYHGLVYNEAFGGAAFIAKLRLEGLRDLGGALSPFNSFEIIQGIETVSLRIQRHSENAQKLAEWLDNNDAVGNVNYPGLKNHRSYQRAQKYLPNGNSGLISFELKGGYEAAVTLVNNVEIISLLANIGDTKSLIIHPASTTHQQLSDAEQLKGGVTKGLIRFSVGIEDVSDIIADLEQAIKKVK
ncbi:MAG: O-acetylhomoserine aminocarboxypropyltransferase/cysteine synthase [Ichthyobacteriaceae bacterium]|nr:O-acetylhomoserine aminocarboxypropyltransferase/cysteine synthase [Ichthyobacteriaceae bacterium]